MKPTGSNCVATLYHGDVRDVLARLPAESIHMVCTSPPYWGLRDYSLLPSVWGGDPHCAHQWGNGIPSPGSRTVDSKESSGLEGAPNQMRDAMPQSAYCHCGAWCGTLGLEPTPDLFVEHIVDVFREVWRVLRTDGTCWVNLGDSYAGSWGNFGAREGNQRSRISEHWHRGAYENADNGYRDKPPTADAPGLKPKDLVMMPARVALALQAEGWWLRSAIIWDKPNPMPESVRDRPTTAHEYIWLLSKSGTSTYWTHRDLPGTRTTPLPDYRWTDRATGIEYQTKPLDWSDDLIDCPDCGGAGEITYTSGQASLFDGPPTLVKICARCNHADAETPGQIRRWKRVNLWRGHDYFYDADAVRDFSGDGWHSDKFAAKAPERHAGENRTVPGAQQAAGANARSVWHIATKGFSEAHFATFPEELPRRCILAGTSERGVCAQCGAPWERMVERTGHVNQREPAHAVNNCPTKTDSTGWAPVTRPMSQWQPSCACDAATVPATVLDPFAGSGTTLAVAQKLGRHSIGIDLSADYLKLAAKRIGAVSLPLPLGGNP